MQLEREQLTGGKGNQRKLIDWCTILFFRWSQNGEMNKINGGIGFEKVEIGRASCRERV